MRLPVLAQIALAAVLGFGAVIAYNTAGSLGPAAKSFMAMMNGEKDGPKGTRYSYCNIKGDIDRTTGKRIFYVPGQAGYSDVQIDTGHGEFWFCSEKQATDEGWAKAAG